MKYFPPIWTFYFLNKSQKCKRLLCNVNFLVASQETKKIKIKRKNLLLVHPSKVFDIRHKCMIFVDIILRFNKSYNHLSHAFVYLAKLSIFKFALVETLLNFITLSRY